MNFPKLSTLSIACLSAFASFATQAYTVPSEFVSDQVSQGAGYISSTIQGNGHNWTVEASDSQAAKLQLQNGANVSNVGNLTVSSGQLFVFNSTLAVNEKLSADLLKLGQTKGADVVDTGTVTVGSADISEVVVNAGSTLSVTHTLNVGKITNSGTTTVGDLNVTGGLTNGSGATLTVNGQFEMTASGKDPTLSNKGHMYFTSGRLEAEAFKLVNNGVLGKSETEALDEVVAREVRNDYGGQLNAVTLRSNGTVYNGEKDMGDMTVEVLEANTIINGQKGTLSVNERLYLTGDLANKGGSVTLNDVSARRITNDVNGNLVIKGTIEVSSSFTNEGTLTLQKGSDFTGTSFNLGNSGVIKVEGGTLEASGMTLRNNASGVICKDGTTSQLDALILANLRNNADLAVDTLKVTNAVYNGEGIQGGGHTLTVGTLDAISILNDQKSTILASGTVTGQIVRNINEAKIQAKAIVADTVDNGSGSSLSAERLEANWIVNEESNLKADHVSVWRLTNEHGSTLDVGTLVMNRDADGQSAWLQLKSDQATHIGSLSGEDIYAGLDASSGAITIDKIEENTGIAFHVPDTKSNQVTILQNNSQKVNVAVDGTVTDTFDPDNLKDSLQQVADTLDIKNGEQRIGVTAEAGTILGELNAKTDRYGNIISVSEGTNHFNVGISEMASVAMMAWRAENNDLFKRLGDVRRGDHNNGLWARFMAGESEYGTQSLENEYTTLQFGYDHRVGANNEWILGGAFTYTNGESTFNYGSGDNYQYGFALYGSYLGETGGYVDVIGKYSRLNNEFEANGGIGKGEYYGNGLSLSVEAGHRFDVASKFYFEPQVEFTYGYLTDVDYTTSEGAQVAQDSMKTAVGRVGINLGKSFEKGNVHIGASYLKDWEGETSVAMTYKDHTRHYAQDLGDDWFEFELGGAYSVRDNLKVYGTFETTTGGKVKTPWQANLGVRLTW